VSYSYESLKKLFEILIFFWVVNCVQENRLRDSLSLVLILVATGASLLGLYQGWTDGVWNGGLINGIRVEGRVEGTMSVYMTFAGLLMLAGIHAFGRVLFRKKTEYWIWIAIIIIFICLLFTLTRQAWFGFLSGFMFLLVVRLKKYWPVTLSLVIVGLLSFTSIIQHLQSMDVPTKELSKPGFIVHFKQRIKTMVSGKDNNFEIRKALWLAGWAIYKDYPLTGCGFRCVDLLHNQYPDPTGYVKKLRGMHNNFIQLAVDTGFFGLATWLGTLFCFFRLLYRKAFGLKKDLSENWTVFGSAAAAIGFLAGGCFETNLYDSEVAMLLYFIMALPFSGSYNQRSA
jgi:O-antigen ligase